MLPDFLTRPVLRLRLDGGVEPAGPREPALGAATVWLARGLCRFERVRAPAGLGRRARLSAARVHARARAPFVQAGHALARTADGGYAVWWWDAAEAARRLEVAGVDAVVRLRPEAAGQAAGGDGWRLLRAEGWEAQRWAAGSLEESAWRRTPFDAAAWSAFARLAATPEGEAAPAGPPPVRPAVVTAASPYAARLVREGELQAAAPGAAMALLALGLGASAVFAGQGLAAARRDGDLQREIAAREAAAPRSRRPELAARARALTQLARLTDRPGPLARLAEARRLLARFDLPLVGFDAGADELAVSVPATAAAGVDLLVEAFEAQPQFAEVRPVLDRDAGTLTLRMRVVG